MIIAVEEVWNKFPLSPLEFARYVDEFDSPWLKAYFDVGNVVFWFPGGLDPHARSAHVKVHLKDFQLDRPNGRFTWRNIGEGDIDWLAVHRAITDVGYRGYVTTGRRERPGIFRSGLGVLPDSVARLGVAKLRLRSQPSQSQASYFVQPVSGPHLQ